MKTNEIFCIMFLFTILITSSFVSSINIIYGEVYDEQYPSPSYKEELIDSNNLQNIFEKLSEKAESNGNVRVIVGLDTKFQAEGKIGTKQEKIEQREKIKNSQDALLQTIPIGELTSSHKFKFIPFVSMTVNKNALAHLSSSPLVKSIHEDKINKPFLDDSIPIIGADLIHTLGFDGSGVAVAILDSGIQSSHSFFDDGAGGTRVVAEACFTEDLPPFSFGCPNGQATQVGPGSAIPCILSNCDHGTHVAGIAAGNGPSFSGVGKNSGIIAIQVFTTFFQDSDCGGLPGDAPCIGAFDSDVAQGLEHVKTLHEDPNFSLIIAAANLSLGRAPTMTGNCDEDPAGVIQAAIENLRSVEIATSVASGNDAIVNALGFSACLSAAVSVGSTTKSDVLSGFSNSAEELHLLAPGSLIQSSVLGINFGTKSGTSMATPHVTGSFALLKQYKPAGTVDELLSALINTGVGVVDTRNPIGPVKPTLIEKPRIQVDQALFSLDNVAPQTTIDSAVDGNLVSLNDGGDSDSDSIEFEFSATDDLSAPTNLTFECNLDSGGYSVCTSPHSLSGINDGTHTLQIRATDEAGNIESTASFTWIVDTRLLCDNMTLDELISSGNYNLIDNRGGPSKITFGTDNADFILAGSFGDEIWGVGGDDCIVGGSGNDELRGQGGSDQIFGSDGNDKLIGNSGDDLLDGGLGSDSLNAGVGNDSCQTDQTDSFAGSCEILNGTTIPAFCNLLNYNIIDNRGQPSATLTGTLSFDLIFAGDNGDTVFADRGRDCIVGGSGNDELRGQGGSDQIFGNDGNDKLIGNWGDDFLDGGAGSDILNAGNGLDTCITDEFDTFIFSCEL